MITFLLGLLILIAGYILYSGYIEKVFSPDDRPVPSHNMRDNVDFVPIPKWRNALIHLLNIAGMGPIIGAVQGILFGPIAFILIPVGCILAGGVHDYFAGMLSIRNRGSQITGLIHKYIGKIPFKIFIPEQRCDKFILFDNFTCMDDGEIIGTANAETIEKMPHCNN